MGPFAPFDEVLGVFGVCLVLSGHPETQDICWQMSPFKKSVLFASFVEFWGNRLLSYSLFVMIAVRELEVFFLGFSSEHLGTSGRQDTGTLLFWAPKGRGAVFCFCFLVPVSLSLV